MDVPSSFFNMNTLNTREERLARAMASLEGLSVGDAFGEQFFMSWEGAKVWIDSGELEGPPFDLSEEFIARRIALRKLPPTNFWNWTDDSAMAFSVVKNLREYGTINPDEMAISFGQSYQSEPARGYGGAMYELLPQLARGESWRAASQSLFNGTGSYGNGASMRVAPIGAYFADDLRAVIENARRSALVTHSHPEAIAGAIAVAVAAALACRQRTSSTRTSAQSEPRDFISTVLEYVPQSEVRIRLIQARDLAEDDADCETAVSLLGCGENISAHDTVPFCIWCAATELDHFDEALWLTVEGLGDRDTTCAIVGGIVACYTGADAIPVEWRTRREALPNWF